MTDLYLRLAKTLIMGLDEVLMYVKIYKLLVGKSVMLTLKFKVVKMEKLD